VMLLCTLVVPLDAVLHREYHPGVRVRRIQERTELRDGHVGDCIEVLERTAVVEGGKLARFQAPNGRSKAQPRALAPGALSDAHGVWAQELFPVACSEPQLLRSPGIRRRSSLAITRHDQQRARTAGACRLWWRELIEQRRAGQRRVW
jgi:hypothetical protein